MSAKLLALLRTILRSAVFRLALSVLFILYVYRNVTLAQIWEQLRVLDVSVMAFFTIMTLLIFVLSAYRWALLIKKEMEPLLLVHVTAASFFGNFYGLYLPTAIGGDTVKWLGLIHLGFSKKTLVLSVLVDRVCGMLGVVLLGCVATILGNLLLSVKIPELTQLLVIILGFASTVFVAIVLLPLRFSSWIQLKLLNDLEKFIERHRMQFRWALILSVITQAIYYFAVFVIMRNLGMSISFLEVFVYAPLISLFLALPLSISGFGATEAIYIYFLLQLDIAPQKILALTTFLLIYRLIFGLASWFIAHGLLRLAKRQNLLTSLSNVLTRK